MSLLNEQFRICPPFESAANRMLETVETETARSGTIILLFDIRRFNGRDERFFSINNLRYTLHETLLFPRIYIVSTRMFAGCRNKN